MIDEDLAVYALQLSTARYMEIRIEKTGGEEVVFVNGMLKESGFYETSGFSLRVIDEGSGFYFSNILTRKEIRRGVERAERMARLHRGITGMSEEKAHQARDEITGNFPEIDEKIAFIKNLDSQVTAHQRVFSYADEMTEKLYMNTDGAAIHTSMPKIYLHYLLTVSDGKVEQMHREFGNTGGWEFTEKWRADEYLQHDASFLHDLIRKGEKPPSRGDIVLAPFITGLIAHESCGHPFEADRILGREAAQAGKSYATESLIGEQLAAECVTVVDNPALPNTYGYYRYDDEGVKARERVLIKNGIVNEFLHNRETAYEMHCNSNASARATYGKESIVRMANTYFAPGDHSLEELIEDVKEGVYMVTFMEWNIDDRRVNQKYVGEEAYLIKNGEIGGIATHPAIEISTFDFYRKVYAAGRELSFYPATCGKGDPMQGIEVSTGGVDLRLRDMVIG